MFIYRFNICLIIHKDTWLVVEPTPLKSMKVSWDDCSKDMEK